MRWGYRVIKDNGTGAEVGRSSTPRHIFVRTYDGSSTITAFLTITEAKALRKELGRAIREAANEPPPKPAPTVPK